MVNSEKMTNQLLVLIAGLLTLSAPLTDLEKIGMMTTLDVFTKVVNAEPNELPDKPS